MYYTRKTVATLKGEIWKYNFDDADKILQEIKK